MEICGAGTWDLSYWWLRHDIVRCCDDVLRYLSDFVPVGTRQLIFAGVRLYKVVSMMRLVPWLWEFTSGVVVHKLGRCKHLSMSSYGSWVGELSVMRTWWWGYGVIREQVNPSGSHRLGLSGETVEWAHGESVEESVVILRGAVVFTGY